MSLWEVVFEKEQVQSPEVYRPSKLWPITYGSWQTSMEMLDAVVHAVLISDGSLLRSQFTNVCMSPSWMCTLTLLKSTVF